MSSGGLVSAMLGVMEDDSMTWIGWPGISVDDEDEQDVIREQLAESNCVPVFLDDQTADEYYNGFCNSVLWPLFHYVQDMLDTSPLQTQWAAYVRANEAFCDAILPRVKEGDTVWVHDYHLMLLPTMLKSRRPSLRVGWFLHTPFPTSEVFRVLPMRDRLIRGLLGADLVGFHTSQYARHFMSAAQRSGEAKDGSSAISVAANTLSLQIPRDPKYAPRSPSAEPTAVRGDGQGEDDSTTRPEGHGTPGAVSPSETPALTDGAASAVDANTVLPSRLGSRLLGPRFKSRFSNAEREAAAETEKAAAVEVEDVSQVADAGSFAHTAHVSAFPIGIAPDRFEDELKKGSCQQAIRELQERFGGRKIMLGVDRLDPIKGIPHKLLAFEALLERHPEYIGEVVLVQIAVPSRLDVALHQQLQQRLHSLAGRINGRFGSLGWVPIHYMDTSVPFDQLVALYAASSAMVISSLRDGMNLVSFEWTVCQAHKPRPWQSDDGAAPTEGVLVLSEFAGAADHLEEGSLMVNPHDTAAFAEALHEALAMPRARRQQLHGAAYDFVTTSTATTWADKYVTTLKRLHASNGLLPDAAAAMASLLAMLSQQPRLVLLTDYDGTLTPIVPDPSAAHCSDDVKAELRRLSQHIPTAIVSGRSREKIEAFVGPVAKRLWVAGAHGFDIAGPAGSGVELRPADEYRGALRAAAASVQLSLAEVPGALIEDNQFAVSVHYRHVAADDLPAVEMAVERALAEEPTLARFPGKKVVELRPELEWNKGKAVDFILEQLEQDADGPLFPIYLGDDVSDEDAFKAVRARGGLAVLVKTGNVAQEETAAAVRLRSPKQVLKMLSQLELQPPATKKELP